MCVQVGVCVCVCVRVWVSIWVQYFGNYFALLVVVTVVTLTPLWTPDSGFEVRWRWVILLPELGVRTSVCRHLANWHFYFCHTILFQLFREFRSLQLATHLPGIFVEMKIRRHLLSGSGGKNKENPLEIWKGVRFIFIPHFLFFFFCCSWPLSFVRVSITPFGPLAPSAPLAPPALGAPFAPLGHSFQFHFFASVLVNGFHAGAISCCCLKSVEWKRLEPIMP